MTETDTWQVGGREDSNVYIRMKLKAAEEIGITASCMKLDRSTTQLELLRKIRELNEDPDVHGIIVQMPLDTTESIDSHLITDAVSAEKVGLIMVDGAPIPLYMMPGCGWAVHGE